MGNKLTLIWHLFPLYPRVHLHENPPMWSVHCAPFKHGFDSHSLYSKLQSSPAKPLNRNGKQRSVKIKYSKYIQKSYNSLVQCDESIRYQVYMTIQDKCIYEVSNIDLENVCNNSVVHIQVGGASENRNMSSAQKSLIAFIETR